MSFTADTLLLFGATGDLARRMLLPSLCALDADHLLPEGLRIVGTARSAMSDAEYRNFARAALETFLPANRRGSMADFLNRLHYQANDVTHPEGFEALANAVREWPNGGMKFGKGDVRSPFDFEAMAKMVRPSDFEGRMVISADPDAHRAEIQRYVDLGFDRIYLHNVGRNQREWIEVFGRDVLPALHR